MRIRRRIPGSSTVAPERSGGDDGKGFASCSFMGERHGFTDSFSVSVVVILRAGGSMTGSGIGGRAGEAFADTAGDGVLEPDFLLRRPILFFCEEFSLAG